MSVPTPKTKRRRHIPQRTCVGCRQVMSKRDMIRVVRTPQGVVVDTTGRLPGRGAYLHPGQACWENALKGPLEHALRTSIDAADRMQLMAFMQTLTDEELD